MSTTVGATLFAIGEELVEVQAALVEAGGELTPELEQRLTAATEAIEEKVDAYGYRIRALQAYAAMHGDRAKFHALQATSYERIEESLKTRLLAVMQRLGTRKLVGTDFTATVSESKRTVVDNPALLPQTDRYWRLKAPELNVEAIRKDLTDGLEIPGVHLESVPHVRLR